MKILHVILGLSQSYGGPPRGLANLATAQAQRGDDVAVVPGHIGSGPQTLEIGRHGNLFVHQPVTNSKLLWYDAKLKRLLREAARDRDILHIHGSWRYHFIGAASVAREYGIPYIVRPAGNMGTVARQGKKAIKLTYFWLFERAVYKHAAAMQCCSKKECRELQEFNLKTRAFIAPQPIESDLPNIQPDFDQLKSRCPQIKDGDQVMLFLGRFSPIKRLDVLLESFIRLSKSYSNWKLLLAGPHEDMSIVRHLEKRIEQTGLSDRVSMPGMATDGFKAACFARADIFVTPSVHENFGLSVAEAFSFGLPCVVSNGVALSEDIAETGAGLVCEPTVDAFEDCLRKMLGDESTRRSCSVAARELVKRFSPHHIAEQMDREYRYCLEHW